MMTKEAMALSATALICLRFDSLMLLMSCTSCRVMFDSNFHTRRKASPMFLLALPPCRATSMWTILAMEFTNSITSSCSTSVVSVNCRMSQKPKMAHILRPGTIGLRSPPCFMFSAMISAPASPKPTASSEQILEMLFSRIFVSNCSSPLSVLSMCWRISGFSVMSLTFLIMRSIGRRTRSFASLLKLRAPAPRMTHTNSVRSMDRMAFTWLSHLTLKRTYEVR
mmetsp:Transcript_14566/g.50060  ORF Transcript_14566/g.50060 Transcript_14566/m.50060 type:complete len:224 (-) Transcript_14566:1168-1839(-)